MIDIMIGHRLLYRYEEWSIFIVKSKLFINENTNESSESLMFVSDNEISFRWSPNWLRSLKQLYEKLFIKISRYITLML